MRDRQKTIESLRRLAERPGTPQEGETARKKLRELEAQEPQPKITYKVPPPNRSYARQVPSVEDMIRMNDLGKFFRQAGYVPQRRSKPSPTSWEDMEGQIRRNIYKGTGQGDID